jgi:hypothetical protein
MLSAEECPSHSPLRLFSFSQDSRCESRFKPAVKNMGKDERQGNGKTKVKLSLGLIKHQTMKAYERVEI